MIGVASKRSTMYRRFGFYVLVMVTLLPILFVFWYTISTSLKSSNDTSASETAVFFSPTISNYKEVLVENDFGSFAKNSAVVAIGSTALGLLIGIPAAFAIAKLRVRRLATIILAGRVAPGITFLIPWFVIFSRLGWTDTYGVLIVAHLLQNLPLMVFLLIGFFEEVPDELLESSRVDGASTVRTIRSIAMPVARGGIAATAILGFIFSWNHFMFSIVLSGNDTRTLPVAVFNFMSYGSVNWGGITAAAMTMALPAMIVTLFAQKHIVHGLASGAVKG
jgi:multiple sugar transport system permease protein